MTYPRSIRRLVVSGAGDGDERFSFSLHLADFPPPTAGNGGGPFAVSDGLVAAVQSLMTQASSARARVDSIKLNDLDINGRYVSQQTIERVFSGASVIKGAAVSDLPAQVSMAVTLRTPQSRGLANKGRFFIPYPKQFAMNDGLISTSDQSTMTTAARNFINAINALGIGQVVVASKVGSGVLNLVNAVSVGKRYDIIRSRGASLDESPVVSSLV